MCSILLTLLVLSMMFKFNSFFMTETKIKKTKWGIYWLLSIIERIISGVLLGFSQKWSLIALISTKLVFFIIFICINCYSSKNQKIRNLIVQILHFILFAVIVFYEFYLKYSSIRLKLPQYLTIYIEMSILLLALVISIFYFIRSLLC